MADPTLHRVPFPTELFSGFVAPPSSGDSAPVIPVPRPDYSQIVEQPVVRPPEPELPTARIDPWGGPVDTAGRHVGEPLPPRMTAQEVRMMAEDGEPGHYPNMVDLVTAKAWLDGRMVILGADRLSVIQRIVAEAISKQLESEARKVRTQYGTVHVLESEQTVKEKVVLSKKRRRRSMSTASRKKQSYPRTSEDKENMYSMREMARNEDDGMPPLSREEFREEIPNTSTQHDSPRRDDSSKPFEQLKMFGEWAEPTGS